jgi:PAS domain S-box-containing protein
MIAAIVLAAGESRRFGGVKQLVLLDRVLAHVRAAGFDDVVVVLGAHADEVRAAVDLSRERVVFNPDFARGMSTSIQAGLRALSDDVEAAMIVLGDQPFVTPETMNRLIDEYRRARPAAVVPTFRGARGNPVLVDRSLFPEMMHIEGDVGFRPILANRRAETSEVAVDDPGVVSDIDTPARFPNADEQLRRSEELFRLLVESVKDYAIFMLDPGGHVMTWNAGAERIKQYKPHEIIGKHFSTFYPEETKYTKPAWELEVAAREGRVEDEGWRVRKDGTRFWANVVITALFDENGTLRGFGKVTRDLTSRREAEETRRALLEQREARVIAEEEKRRAEASYRAAQETNRAKDEFLMTLSHELRTPMTAILGWSRMLPKMKPGDPSFNDAIAAIARSAKLQAELIDDVLDVSRIVSGKLRLNVDNISVVEVLQAALDAVRPSADAKSITLTTSFSPSLGIVAADATRLQQVTWNLLSNAIKFTPKNGRVELAAKRTASQLQICVTDTGEGIDTEFLPHVFEAFRQAETPSTRVHGGLGLGLSIVRYLAEAHGGTVTAESEGRGKGARFTVTLPVLAVHPHAMPAEIASETALEPMAGTADLHGLRILVVDDDHDGRGLIAAVLRQAGAAVTAVDSADAALAAMQAGRYDIVLTDIAMPRMDGYSLQRKLRELGLLDKTRIVALTAFPGSAVAADEREFDSYLRKPIDPFELTENLRALLPN